MMRVNFSSVSISVAGPCVHGPWFPRLGHRNDGYVRSMSPSKSVRVYLLKISKCNQVLGISRERVHFLINSNAVRYPIGAVPVYIQHSSIEQATEVCMYLYRVDVSSYFKRQIAHLNFDTSNAKSCSARIEASVAAQYQPLLRVQECTVK